MTLIKRRYSLSGTGLPFRIEVYQQGMSFIADVIPCGSNQPVKTLRGSNSKTLMVKANRWLMVKR